MNTTMKPLQEDAGGLGYLLTAYLFESLSEEGRREVEERLAADPAARAELEELRATLELVEESLQTAGGARPGAYSFENSRMERVLAASGKRPVFRVTRRRLVLGIAALLVGLVSLCSLYLLLVGGASMDGHEMASSGWAGSARGGLKGARLSGLSERDYRAAAPEDEKVNERRGIRLAALSRLRAEGDSEINEAVTGGTGFSITREEHAGRLTESRKPVPVLATENPKTISATEAEAPQDGERDNKKLAEFLTFAGKGSAEVPDFKRMEPTNRAFKGDLNALKNMDKAATEKTQSILAIKEEKPGRDKGHDTLRRRKQVAGTPGKKAPAKPGKGRPRALNDMRESDSSFSKEPEGSADQRDLGSITIAGALGRNGIVSKDTKPMAKESLLWDSAASTRKAVPPGLGLDKGKSRGRKSKEKIQTELGRNPAIELGAGEAGKYADRSDDSQEELDPGDIFFDEEMPQQDRDDDGSTGEAKDGMVDQLAGEGAITGISLGQTIAPIDGNFRLNISRQDGRLIPLGNDAGLAKPPQRGQLFRAPRIEGQPTAEARPGVSADIAFPRAAQEQEREEDLLVVNEDTLNTFSYYRRLDRRLSFDQFRSRSLSIPPPAIGDEGLGEKGFLEKYGVNPFVATSRDHLSTFGMDVDNASWGRVREILKGGLLPVADIVRVEEFVNNFSDERPGNPDSVFTVFTEGGPSPFGGSELELLQITIKSRDLLPEERKNAVLTFAVDTSGSMASHGKLELLRESLKALVANLGPNDRVAIVAFSTNAFVVLPHTSARQRAHIEAAIDSLSPDGGTNVEAGIDLAYRLAGESHDRRAANRVLLCSDGVANLGAKGPEAILERIRRFAEGNLVSLFTYAFGTGGRQAVQGDRMLQRLADEGDGRYQYVDSSQRARNLFSLPDQLQFLASDAKIQVDFNPEVISHYRLLGYEKRDIADVDFRNDKIDAGEVGPGSTVTALYEIKRARPIGSLGRIHLRYRDETSRRFEEFDFELPTGVLAGRLEDTTDRFRFIAAVAEFAEILRQSHYARDGSYGAVLQVMASNSAPYRARAEWREARELITRAQGLSAVEALQALEAQELFSP